MSKQDLKPCAIAVYESGAGAVEGVRALLRSGWDIDRLSVAGQDSFRTVRPVGLYTSGNRAKFWAVQAESWNALSDELTASSLFVVPMLGPLVVVGPLVDGFIATLESIQGQEGIVAAVLMRGGIPPERAAHYETCVEKGRIVVAASGDADRVARAHEVVDVTRPLELASYVA